MDVEDQVRRLIEGGERAFAHSLARLIPLTIVALLFLVAITAAGHIVTAIAVSAAIWVLGAGVNAERVRDRLEWLWSGEAGDDLLRLLGRVRRAITRTIQRIIRSVIP